jgi:fumarate reductase subunit C
MGQAMTERVGWDRTEAGSSPNPEHTRYHPRWHRERIPLFWWTRNRRYIGFIVRELTAVLVLYACCLLLAQMVAVGRGVESYQAFVEWLARPWVLALHAFVLAGLLFHSVTWLNLAPKALILRVGSRKVPPRLVLVGHYAAWLGTSALIVLAVVWGMG